MNRTVYLRNARRGWEWSRSLDVKWEKWRGPYRNEADARRAAERSIIDGGRIKPSAYAFVIVEDDEK